MENDDDFDDIRELVSDYEASVGQGIQPFLDVDDTIDIAQYYDDNGQTDDARRVLLHGLSLHPGESEILSFLVRITLVDEGDIDKARQYASQIEGRDNIDYYLANSDILIAQGRLNEADKLVQKGWKQFSSDDQTDLCIDVAQMYVLANEYERARRWLLRCPDKSSIDYLEMLGDVLMTLGRAAECEQVCVKLLDIDAFSVVYWDNLATAQIMQNKFDEADDSVGYALAIVPDDFRARDWKAYLLSVFGETKASVEMFEALLRDYSAQDEADRDAEFICMMAVHYGRVLLADDGAARVIDLVAPLQRAGGDAYNRRKYELTRLMCMAYVALGDFGSAIREVDGAIRPDDESYPDFCVLKGNVLLNKRCVNEAARCFNEAIDSTHDMAATLFDMSMAYYDCAYYENAEWLLRNGVLKIQSSYGWAYLASCHHKLGNTRAYFDILKKACRLCPREVVEVFFDEMPRGMAPADFYNYVVSRSDKPDSRSRKNKGE